MKLLIFFSYLFVLGAELLLAKVNLRYLERFGSVVPPAFKKVLAKDRLASALTYSLAKGRLGMAESLYSSILLVVFIFGGVLPWYDGWVQSLSDHFVVQGLVFFLPLLVIKTILAIPFDVYRTFVLESRYDFNTTSWRLWISDLVKGLLLGGLITALLIAGSFALVEASPGYWWVWVWIFLASVTLFLMYLSPTLIEPLFFKFEPVKNRALEEKIRELTQKAGLQVSQVQQVDASRRSRHSNAYFTGIGRVKRIVLFDTLLEQMSEKEVLAVLAHEIGHWKKHHVFKRLLTVQGVALLVCLLSYVLIGWGRLPEIAGMSDASFSAQLLLLSLLGSIAGFFWQPVSSALSRRDEWQADDYAATLTGTPPDLADALVKLSVENLANLHPHPAYAWFYYSHPPVTDRVKRLLESEHHD